MDLAARCCNPASWYMGRRFGFGITSTTHSYFYAMSFYEDARSQVADRAKEMGVRVSHIRASSEAA